MLQFNPYNRPTVGELLSDGYFDDVRSYSEVYEASEEISFPFDEGRKKVNLAQLRDLFIDEIEHYRELRNTTGTI